MLGEKIDFETFVAQEELEWHGAEGPHDMNLLAVMKMADYVVQNNESLEKLHQKIDVVLKK